MITKIIIFCQFFKHPALSSGYHPQSVKKNFEIAKKVINTMESWTNGEDDSNECRKSASSSEASDKAIYDKHSEIFSLFHKNSGELAKKFKKELNKINSLKKICILGHSLSDIDSDYISVLNEICKKENIPLECSWHGENQNYYFKNKLTSKNDGDIDLIDRPDISIKLKAESQYYVAPPKVLNYEAVYNFPKLDIKKIDSSTFYMGHLTC